MLTDNIKNYYAKNKEEFNKILGSINYKTKIYRDDENNNIIEILDNEELLLKAQYEVAGYYNLASSIWIWGWANPFIERDLTDKVNEIRDQEKMFITTEKLDDKTKQLYLYFIRNPSFYIANNNLTDLLSMTLYYTNDKWILPRNILNTSNTSSQLEFILIKNILQINK